MKKLLVLAMIVMLPVSLLWATDGVKDTDMLKQDGKALGDIPLRVVEPDHNLSISPTQNLILTTLLTEDFENGGVIPIGWTDSPGTYPWQYDAGADHGPGSAHGGSYAAYYDNWTYSSGTVDSLISPVIDFSAYSGDYIVSFWGWHQSGSDSVVVYLYEAGSLTRLDVMPNTTSWTQHTFNFSSTSSDGKIYFIGYSRYGSYNSYIDDVEVAEYVAPTIDVAVLSIDSPTPPAYLMFPGTYTITATLANLMVDAVTLDSIEFKVEDSTPAEVFRDVRTGDQIASYDTTQFSSTTDWTVSVEDWYTVTVTAYVEGDGNLNDNALAGTRIVKTVRSYPWTEDFETVLLDASEWVVFGEGVYITSSYYHSPTTSVYFSYSPYPRTAWLVSPPITLTSATDPMMEFFEACYYCGDDPDETHGAFFATGLFDFAGWDTLAFYDSSHAITDRSDYANAPAERFLVSDHIGDTVWVVFEYNAVYSGAYWYLDDISLKEKPLNDVGPTELVSGTMSEKNTAYTPVVEFTNFAGDTPTFQVRLIIDTNAVEIYNETDTIYTMAPFGTEEVTFPNYTPTESGTYNLTAISELPTVLLDADPSNDTLTATLTVYDEYEDFEADDGDLFGTNDWEWGEQTSSTYGPGGAYSGINCWGTVLNGDVSDNTTSNLDFYVNVTASFIPPTPILDEGFESGIPVTWTDSPGTSPWFASDGYEHYGDPNAAHSGDSCAYFDCYVYSAGTIDSLITPSMNLSGTSNLKLEFWFFSNINTSYDDTLVVYLSESGVLTRLGVLEDTEPWTKVEYPLNSTDTDAKIYFVGYSDYGYGLIIDDVKVVEDVTPPIEFSFYQWHEGSTSSYYFRIFADSGQGYEQLAEWQGSDTEWKKYTVEALANYSDTVKIRLQCDNTSTYDYAGWYVDDFMLTGCEMWLPQDDIAAISIDEPTGFLMVDYGYDAKGTFSNLGTLSQTFDAIMTIEDTTTVPLAVVYADTISVILGAGEDTTITFDTFTPLIESPYTFTMSVENPGDYYSGNNEVTATFDAYEHFSEGGPDAYGYRYIDSYASGGLILEDPPVFSYIDITATGDTSGTGSGNHGQFPIGFTFNFYGQDFDSVYINGYGYIEFGGFYSSSTNDCPMPNSSTPNEPLIAGFWDSGYPSSTYDGAVLYETFGTEPDRYMVIQYHNWRRSSTNLEWEIILHENGNIIFQYDNVDQVALYCAGQSAAVGMEDYNIPSGFSYICNDDNPGNRLQDGLAIKWYFAPPSIDAALTSIDEPTGIIFNPTTVTPTVTVTNNSEFAYTIDVDFLIIDELGDTVYNQSETTAEIPGEGGQVQHLFSTTWDADTDGDYEAVAFVTLAGDGNTANDTSSVDFIVATHYSEGYPDDFGYRYIDNFANGGLILEDPPVFSYIDITATGDTAGTGSSNYGQFEIGFPFEFYGQTYDSVYIDAYGYLNFGGYYHSSGNDCPLPSSSSPWQALIGGFWDYGYCNATYDGACLIETFGTEPDRYMVIQFHNWRRSSYNMEFEIILYEDGKVLFQYLDIDDVGSYGAGQSATVGMESDTVFVVPRSGITYLCNDDNVGNRLQDSLAIKWYYQPYIHNISAEQFLSPPGAGIAGDPIIPEVEFKNRGLVQETSVPVRLLIDPGAYDDPQTIPSIDSAGTAAVTFSQFTPTSSGSYTLTAIAELAGDENAVDDTLVFSYTAFEEILDFEADGGGLAPTGDWEWGTPTSGPGSAYSGVNCWATNLDGNYTPGLHTLVWEFVIGTTNPLLGFTQWYDTEPRYDGGNFGISTDGGTTWTTISPDRGYDNITYSANPLDPDSIFTGHDQMFWEAVTFDLSAYAGMTVLARLAFGADGSVFYPGWYVDDFGTIDCEVVTGEIVVVPSSVTGEADPGFTDADTLTVSNIGDGTLNFTSRALQDPFTVSADGTVEPLPVQENIQQEPIGYRPMSEKESGGKEGATAPYYPPVILDSGGPDDFGYMWVDSDEPGGPAYGWIDISTIGTEVTWDNGTVDDGWTNPLTMGMTFNFYGVDYTNIVISTNGWASFLTQTNSHLGNDPIPNTDDPNAVLAVLWDDQDGGTVGHCYYYFDATENQFIVSWVNWPWYPDPTDPHDYQIILDGDDGLILYQYGSGVFQEDITVGIENEDGTVGLQVAYNQPYVHTDLAVLFYLPIQWLSIDVTEGSIPPAGAPIEIEVGMDATELPAGIFTGRVEFTSNSPSNPVLDVPVTFIVGGLGTIAGNVTDFNNGSPIEGAIVTASLLTLTTVVDTTDASGNYSIDITPGSVEVTASAIGYADSTVTVTVTENVTTTADFALRAPIASIDTSPIEDTVSLRSTETYERVLTNDGTAPLDYNVTLDVVDGGLLLNIDTPSRSPKPLNSTMTEYAPKSGDINIPIINAFTDMLFWFDTQTSTGDDGCLGMEFDGTYFWVTGRNAAGGDIHKLHKYDRDGNWIASYDQGTSSTWGWRDMAWDGTYLYAGDENELAIIDPATGLKIGTMPWPAAIPVARGLAYDPATDHFWTANWGSKIYEFDRTGAAVDSFDNTLSIYGMAWDYVSDGGPYLWTFSQDAPIDMRVSQFDPSTGTYTGVAFDATLPPGYTEALAGGACFTTEWDPNYAAIFVLGQGTPTDFISGYEITLSWLSVIENASGTIDPDESDTIKFKVDFTDTNIIFEDSTYEANANINNNSIDPTPVILFSITAGPAGYDYIPGDINGDENVMGNDVTYGVRYFKQIGNPPPDSFQLPDESWLYAALDCNGSCSNSASDVTYLVMYFKGLHDPNCIRWCADLPPLEFPPFVCPPEEPVLGNESKAVIHNINR